MSTLNYDKPREHLPPPPWTNVIPEKEYHQASLAGHFLSSGMLKEFRRCPAHYRALVLGTARKRESDAFRLGRAVHKLLLEGERAFRAAFTVGGPINERTGRSFGPGTKAFDEWLAKNGLDKRSTLTRAEESATRRIVASARGHREVTKLFEEGWPELSARAEMEGVPCQIRLDWLRPDLIAVDVKTVEDISRFEGDARRFGYLHQFAFYFDGVRSVAGDEPEMTAVILEKKPPHRAGVWRFSRETLEPYVMQNRRSLAAVRRCRETGRWPTGYETPRNFPPAGIPPVWLN